MEIIKNNDKEQNAEEWTAVIGLLFTIAHNYDTQG
jgi:hypothetical protein